MTYLNRFFFLFVLLICASCEQRNVDDEIIADWRFVSITDTAGADVRKIGPEDLMRIRKDRTFTYKLALEDVMARGDWQVKDDSLIYIYDGDNGRADYTRGYKIMQLSDTTLTIEEKGIQYRFRKERE